MDKNIVILEGKIGDDFKYGKTTEGKEFATFSLVISSASAFHKGYQDDSERRKPETYLRIMVFDAKQVDYLHKIGAKNGHTAIIYARLSSHKTEYKGIDFIQNNVVVRDLSIIKK